MNEIKKQIEELERQLSVGATFGTLSEEEITQLQQQINELRKQLVNPFLADIPKANVRKEVKSKEIQEEIEEDDDDDYGLILCSHKNLLDGTTGKQYNSYSHGINLGFVDNERVNGEMNKFIYDKDIETRRQEFLEQGIKVPSKRVLENDFKFLSKLGYVDIINTKSGVCYILKQSYDSKYFVEIPMYKWRELSMATNRNMLKLFVIITIKCNYIKHTQITYEYLCKCMDIDATDGNKKYIGTMVNSLRKLGMIDIQEQTISVYNEETNKKQTKTHYYYRLTTKKEYEEKNNIPKKK